MIERCQEAMKQAGSQTLLIILVGESGAGKSTFSNFIDQPDCYYCSSGAIEEELAKAGQPVNHDTIHAFANRAYGENPEWQVPNILQRLKGRRYLILDGPRRLREVEALRRTHPATLIVRITAPEEERYRRLCERDGIDRETFLRVLRDESIETELGQILAMADHVISNDGTLDGIRREAEETKMLLNSLGGKDEI